jgi:hypothetical protein
MFLQFDIYGTVSVVRCLNVLLETIYPMPLPGPHSGAASRACPHCLRHFLGHAVLQQEKQGLLAQ